MIEIIKRWFWYVVGIGILLLLATTCTNSLADRYFGKGDVLQEQYHKKIETLNQEAKKSKKIIDSLHEDNNQKDMQIGGLNELTNDQDNKIKELTRKHQDGVKIAKKYTYKESAEYISKTYNAPQSVTYDNKGITLGDSIPQKVVVTHLERNYFKSKLKITELKLDYKGKEVSFLEGKVKNKDLEIQTISTLSSRKDDALDASADLIQNQEKQIKKIKTARTLERIAIGVGVVAGGILLIK